MFKRIITLYCLPPVEHWLGLVLFVHLVNHTCNAAGMTHPVLTAAMQFLAALDKWALPYAMQLNEWLQNIPGYQWFRDSALTNGMEMIKQYPLAFVLLSISIFNAAVRTVFDSAGLPVLYGRSAVTIAPTGSALSATTVKPTSVVQSTVQGVKRLNPWK